MILTYRGLLRLHQLWKEGKSMPPNWESSVKRYVNHKRARRHLDDKGLAQLQEAERIAKIMLEGDV